MASRIIKTPPTWPEWWQTAPGQYLWDWECAQFDTAVANLFGYHALQLGMPELDTLRANRIPHRWLALDTPPADGLNPVPVERLALHTNFAALPFPEACLDLVVLPHTLERNADPHATLREVARVLVPEGRVVLSGFNPISLWGLRQSSAQRLQRRGWGELYLPDCPHALTHHRLHDWLQLLDLEVEVSHFGGYRPAVRGEPWLRRWAWMDEVGRRWWPILGAVYLVVAVKRVHGMRLYKPGWTQPLMRGAAVAPLTRYHRPSLSSPEEPLEPR